MSKRLGQASLEYLTTYGWAFILIIVMIGAMAWFGVLDPKNWVSDRCNFGPEFGGPCKEHKLSTAEVRFRLKNSLPDPQKIKSITFKTEEGKTLDCTAPADLITFTWPTGEFKDFVFTGCKMGDVGITAGSKEKILVTIVYFSVKGGADYSHEGKGEILSRVQATTP